MLQVPNASQTVDWNSNQHQSEDESRMRSEAACSALRITEQQAVTSAHSLTCIPPHVQTSLLVPLPTSVFNLEIEALENNDARPQKRFKKEATSPARIAEQAVAPTLQETCDSSHSQIPPSQANTFQRQDRTICEISIPPDTARNKTSTLQGAHNFTVKDHARITNVGTIRNVNHYGQLFGLDIMEGFMEKYVSLNAVHDSPVQDPDRQCHPETRRNVLKQIHDWIDNPDQDESIFWLRGPAGFGKSAIAQTVARSYSRQQVVATFFFYKSDPSRNDGNKLFTTIAWQLALMVPAIRIHIINSLNERPDLPRKDVETQFQELIVKPLQALTSASSQTQLSPLVIIIDGVDECVDEKLQRRFLKVIGNAVNDPDFPLRFLICSRPEVHIGEAIDRFECPPLLLDLAELGDAYDDIGEYLEAEFSWIASEQDLDPTWLGDDRIEHFVYKSSGHFIYASTFIKIIGDKHSSATTQLNLVLGLKPHGEKSLFAELDCLYMEVLQRQPDWHFLTDLLSILIGGYLFALNRRSKTYEYAICMNIPEQELCRKLSGMRSLLRLDPHLDVYHLSFLDFLYDSSHSGQYYIDQHAAQRRYLDFIVASIVRYVPIVFEQPDCHEPHFGLSISLERSNLPVEELQTAFQPLVYIQDKLLSVKRSSFLRCDECDITYTIWNLLFYLKCHQETSKHDAAHSAQVVEQGQSEHAGPFGPLTQFFAKEVEQIVVKKSDLDVCPSSVLVHLRETKLEFPPSVMIIDLMCSLLSFDYAKTADRVRSISDGQVLVDAIDCMINNEDFLRRHGTATARKAAHLAFKLHLRVPVLPRSLFYLRDLSQCCILDRRFFAYAFMPMFMARILDSNYVLRLSCISEEEEGLLIVCDNTYEPIGEWRRSNPGLVMMLRVMLKVAKAIQYLDSMGILLHNDFDLDDIYLDSECHVKIVPLISGPPYEDEVPHEENVPILGIVFYELYFDVELCRDDIIECPERPPEPEISEELWQVIEQCCTADPDNRPTIDEVVEEMESLEIAEW